MVVTPTFHEDWFSTENCAVLARLVRDAGPGLIVEIGSWEGRSTIAMATATDRNVFAVDTWQGSPGEISAALAAGRDVFAQFLANTAHLLNVIPVRSGWREFVATLTGGVALVFIDAEHTYEEVCDTITAFLPLMAPGGIICGDDVQHWPVRKAAIDTLGHGRVTQEGSMWIHRR